MLDGIWEVYDPNGTHIGRFETRTGDEVLLITNPNIAAGIKIGDILHMDAVFGNKAWEVRVTGQYRERQAEFVIEKVSERASKYPKREVIIEVRSWG